MKKLEPYIDNLVKGIFTWVLIVVVFQMCKIRDRELIYDHCQMLLEYKYITKNQAIDCEKM